MAEAAKGGGDSTSTPRKSQNLNLSAPVDDVDTTPDAPLPVTGVLIGAAGLNQSFVTSLNGFTLFYMINRAGPGLPTEEAEICLTWQSRSGPQVAQMVTNQSDGTAYYRDLFGGARVTITNLSPRAVVEIRSTLG